MAVTPQTNTDLGAIAEALRSRDDFIICGHVSPDGDCLGSQLGLAAALKGLGKRVTDRKSTRLNSSHITRSRMPSSA